MSPERNESNPEERSLVRVARVGRPHGIRGEVTVQVFTDTPQSRFIRGASFELASAGESLPGVSNRLTLEAARWNKKILLLKFAEISDRNAAEALRNSELFVLMDNTDDVEEWYAADLIGLRVHEEHQGGPEIGKVTDLVTGAAQDLLEVRVKDGKQVLVPFVEEIIPEIDIENRTIVITPPPGLLELNQD